MTARTTIARTIAADCDSCGSALDTEKFDFATALDVMRAEDWRAVRDGERWTHLCEDCA